MTGKRGRKRTGRVVLGREKERNERAEQILKELEEEKFKRKEAKKNAAKGRRI